MARKNENRVRSKTISFYTTPEEYADIQARIKVSGMPKGEYFIQSLLHQKIQIYVGKYQSDRLALELKRLREALNNTTADEETAKIINSVSFADGNRYYDTPANYRKMRRISDRLCEEYGLSVIRNPKNKGKHYAEWDAERNGLPTIRGQVREELDEIIKASYTMNEFWRILKERGYVVYRQSEKYKYISFVPPYGTKRIRLDKLGSRYTEDAIRERIISARNGIREFSESKDYNAWLKKYEPQKLKGFKALYYHYLYLFGRIRKKETPQRVSFYMREELIKLERYQKQFHFLYHNDLETKEQVQAYKSSTEDKIRELIHSRSLLYGKSDTKEQIAEINKELRELRKDVRLCNNILEDCEHIRERFDKATELEEQAKSERSRKSKSVSKDEISR